MTRLCWLWQATIFTGPQYVLDQPYYIANKIDPLGPINLTPTTQVATNKSGDDQPL